MSNYANSNHPPRGPPSKQPPPQGNPATFFVDQKKGEINELKQVSQSTLCSSCNQQEHSRAQVQAPVENLGALASWPVFLCAALVSRRRCTQIRSATLVPVFPAGMLCTALVGERR